MDDSNWNDWMSDQPLKRRKLDEEDYNRFKREFLALKDRVFNKLGNPQGRATLQESFTLFGLEEGIRVTRQSNPCDNNIIRLGIPLCEGLGIPAHEVYLELVTCYIQEISEEIYKNIQSLRERLLDLQPIMLDFVNTRFLNRITITLLDALPKPADLTPYLALLKDEEAMDFCPLRLKQLLWKQDPKAFRDALLRHVEKLTSDEKLVSQTYDVNSPILTVKLKLRQEHPALKDIVAMIDTHYELYEVAAELLADLYASSGHVIYCNLRFELLMAFHRAKIAQITSKDLIFNFVWAMDAAVLKNGTFEERIRTLLDPLHEIVPKFRDRDHIALGMVLRASFAMDWCARQAYRVIWTTNKPIGELKSLLDLMDKGFASRMLAKYGVQAIQSNKVADSVEKMTKLLRDLRATSQVHRTLSDEALRNAIESMNTAPGDKSSPIFQLRAAVYLNAKVDAISSSLLGQFVIDRFKEKDFGALHAVLSVLRQLVSKAESEKEQLLVSWSRTWPPVTGKEPPLAVSFSVRHGICDPYLPLFRTLLNYHYQQPERAFELLSNKNATTVLIWRFLCPLALVHYPTQEALLDLIIHIQGLIFSYDSGSVYCYRGSISVMASIVDTLANAWCRGLSKDQIDPTTFGGHYRQIADNMVKFGSQYNLTVADTPNAARLLGYIQLMDRNRR